MVKILKSILILILTVSFFSGVIVSAQSLSTADRARLQAEYDQLQKEIAEWQKVLDETRAKKNTLQGDVSLLNAQIEQATREIKQRNVKITTLNDDIKQKTVVISSLEKRINDDKVLLANLIKKKDQNEVQPIFYLLLSANDLSAMISSVDNIATINQGLQNLFEELRGKKTETQKAKSEVEAKKNQELDAQYEIEQKKNQITKNQTEKKQLLAITTQVESNYQNVLADRQRRAETIRSALFNLRDTDGIPFSTALEYAQNASAKTGVRASVILAILSQESDLGKNIGSCYVSNLNNGDGVGKNTGSKFEQVMKAPRDTEPFQKITKALGLNWTTSPVSCPLGAVYYVGRGFGGAMGPSQFIPSTWELFTPRLKTTLGVSQPNPWNPKDAIMATAIYLADLGASGQTFTAERDAACKYYSGRACDNKTPKNYFYGDSVVAKAAKFQDDIDFLKDL